MLRLKIVRYSILISSLLGVFVPLFSDSIKQETIGRYDLRWSHEVDKKARLRTIVIRNNGPSIAEGLLLELRPESPDAIVDFDTSSSDTGPYYSFSNALASSWSSATSPQMLKDPEREAIRQVIDTHAVGKRLEDLQSTFDRILIERIKSANGLQKGLDYLQKVAKSKSWHKRWLENCARAKSGADCAKIDTLIGTWEQTKDVFYSGAIQNWVGATGVALQSQERDGSDPSISLRLALRPSETRYIRFRYSKGRDGANPTLTSMSGAHTNLVNSNQLDSCFLSLFWDLHKFMLIVGVFIVILIALLLAPFVIPTPLLSTRRIFNIAAQTDDHEFWKTAIERHRYFILEEFRELRRIYRPQFVIDSEQVLDYVRTKVSAETAASNLRLASQAELDGFISDQLRIMLLTAQ